METEFPTGLILQLTEGEVFRIDNPNGEPIRIGVTKSRGGKTSLIVDAPRKQKVLREELLPLPVVAAEAACEEVA